jgi:hypothetical protein
MKLQVPFIQLPLVFDAEAMSSEVEFLGEAPWKPHPQGFPGNSMLPLVAVGGDPDDESFDGEMQPTPHLRRCPYLMRVLAALGATVGRTRLMRLAGQAEVNRHADQGYYWTERVRVHVPIVTQPTVRFECGDAATHMAAGECWIFDTWRQHRVVNDATQARIHLVCDTVGGGRFWQLVAQGRPHDASKASWRPAVVEPGDGSGDLRCERVNIPVVMTPWELNSHFGLLFSDAIPHPQLALVRHSAMRLVQQWQGLWAAYGDHEDGHALFRETLRRFFDEIKPASPQLRLRNELLLYNVMVAVIGKFGVREGGHRTRLTADEHRVIGDNA